MSPKPSATIEFRVRVTVEKILSIVLKRVRCFFIFCFNCLPLRYGIEDTTRTK